MDMSLFQLDRKAVDEMDSNLTEGQEMEILYHELIKTIPQNYLDMESVRWIADYLYWGKSPNQSEGGLHFSSRCCGW